MDKFDFMKYALTLAQQSGNEGEVPVGAIVVCDGKIVGEGRNRREVAKNALHHAEIEAIDNACKKLGGWRLWKCDLYVTLEPCPMCAGAIINSRIKNVYFGATDEKNGAVISAARIFDMNFTHKPIYEGGIMGEECAKILSDFFKDLRKKKAGEEN